MHEQQSYSKIYIAIFSSILLFFYNIHNKKMKNIKKNKLHTT